MWNAAHAKRLVYLVHRWTGIGTCVLIGLWLVSGVVMLFVGYPGLRTAERLQQMPALSSFNCCVAVDKALAHSADRTKVQQISLLSIAGQPVYRIREGNGALLVVNAITGERSPKPDSAFALKSASAFLANADGQLLGTTQDDRWTHSGALDAHRPLFKIQMNDAAAHLLYVSSTTGEVMMDAPRAERMWNYVGAWLHWLYMFRDGSRDPFWHWLVVVLSTIGTFSAITGALAGVWRWRFRGRFKSGAKTPYREFHMHWHHITGLVFGTMLVLWIFSGLMSMNPFGMFDARGAKPDVAAYRGGTPGATHPDLLPTDAIAALARSRFNAVEIEWRVVGGTPYLLARDHAANTRIVMKDAQVLEQLPADLQTRAAKRLFAGAQSDLGMIDAYESFYVQRGPASMYGSAERRLPAMKATFDDAGKTVVYLDRFTGDIASSLDSSQRTGRWLFNLLHSWDLPVMLKQPIARDASLILLSLGSLAIAITGIVIGWRRLRCKLMRSPKT